MRHAHNYVAIPITGDNVWSGEEELFGFRAECETCRKSAKTGDEIRKVAASFFGKAIPKEIILKQPYTIK